MCLFQDQQQSNIAAMEQVKSFQYPSRDLLMAGHGFNVIISTLIRTGITSIYDRGGASYMARFASCCLPWTGIATVEDWTNGTDRKILMSKNFLVRL
jgi:hypothetical protein